ncbi:cyclic nucleotide-binding domain-containing protein [Actinoplanes nipponensis]|uniref:cyclic nucleotide-binding domain-containing protein n=1 Tax=Actinoplanes nipponensis TaxID=135950 RepID=UPI00194550A1|nr:cyclic nucleotide-binding domain-containing protein [Actinoplanes nipponensis]
MTVFDELVLHPFLGDLPMGWLHRLAAHGRTVVRPAGYRLCRPDGPAECCWLLRSGAVDLDGPGPGRGDVVLGHVGADGVVGCSWLVEPYRYVSGAVVTEEIRAVEFAAAGLRNLIGEDPALGLELTTRFVTVLTGRLRTSTRRWAELHLDDRGDSLPRRAGEFPTAGPPALC